MQAAYISLQAYPTVQSTNPGICSFQVRGWPFSPIQPSQPRLLSSLLVLREVYVVATAYAVQIALFLLFLDFLALLKKSFGSSRKAGGLGASFLGAVRFHWAVEDR